jgi:hypothetical protein
MIGRVEELRKKVSILSALFRPSSVTDESGQLTDLHETSGSSTQQVMRDRFEHISSLEDIVSQDDPAYGRWADKRVDRWLVDWALRNGMDATAKRLASDKGIEVSNIISQKTFPDRLSSVLLILTYSRKFKGSKMHCVDIVALRHCHGAARTRQRCVRSRTLLSLSYGCKSS